MGGVCPKAALNAELNSTARNTNDTAKLRRLVNSGARLDSTNGAPWHHTPLHQACYHNRPEIVRALLELGAFELCARKRSNPCGRGGAGFPIDLARGGGHLGVVDILENYAKASGAVVENPGAELPSGAPASSREPPKEVHVSGAGIWWCNDTWTLAGTRNGRPYWRRNGNRTDCLAWVPSKGGWTLSGTPGAGDSDVYVSKSSTPLPPKGGWAPRKGGGSFGSTVPSPAPRIDYKGGGASPSRRSRAYHNRRFASRPRSRR